MKKILVPFFIIAATGILNAQEVDKIITVNDVQRIESILSSDGMQGRKAFTPGADKAAEFISKEFKKIGLEQLPGTNDYKQIFTMVSSVVNDISATVDGNEVDKKNIIPFSSSAELNITEASGFTKAFLKKGADFRKELGSYIALNQNVVVFVDPSFAANFQRLNFLKQHLFKSPNSVVFILGSYAGEAFKINISQTITEQQAANVVGIIPGKSKKEEMVVFSGHYDHLGVAKEHGADSIYNGANDDASGITAVIELAKYYKAAKNNERTLVFAAFTAEEIGGYGSQYFSKQLDADKVVAMFNIEMIGTESKWGKNSAYITGFEKSSLGEILQKNLQGTGFTFYPDPYTTQNLFYRSDNATLARLGVAAHTISTSKMDSEPNYHKLSDEIRTLNVLNMMEIIKSVIVSAQSIVSGKDTPSRVKADELTR